MKFLNLILITILLSNLISCSKSKVDQESLFSFEADERLFTAFAFMNAAGFDGEWRDEGMNQIRIEIRNEVIPKLDFVFINKMKDFHFSHGRGSWSKYAPLALITSGPTNFEVQYNEQSTQR